MADTSGNATAAAAAAAAATTAVAAALGYAAWASPASQKRGGVLSPELLRAGDPAAEAAVEAVLEKGIGALDALITVTPRWRRTHVLELRDRTESALQSLFLPCACEAGSSSSTPRRPPPARAPALRIHSLSLRRPGTPTGPQVPRRKRPSQRCRSRRYWSRSIRPLSVTTTPLGCPVVGCAAVGCGCAATEAVAWAPHEVVLAEQRAEAESGTAAWGIHVASHSPWYDLR